jgi:hypothetical protein
VLTIVGVVYVPNSTLGCDRLHQYHLSLVSFRTYKSKLPLRVNGAFITTTHFLFSQTWRREGEKSGDMRGPPPREKLLPIERLTHHFCYSRNRMSILTFGVWPAGRFGLASNMAMTTACRKMCHALFTYVLFHLFSTTQLSKKSGVHVLQSFGILPAGRFGLRWPGYEHRQ